MPDKFFYKGIPSPNGTIVPDDIFDVLMPVCSGAGFKVLAYIVRRTFGFKKESDTISLKQMVEGITTKDGKVLDRGTGLSKSTVAVAIKGLVEKGIIEVQRNSSKAKGDEPTTYQLRFEVKDPVSENNTGGSPKTGQGLVQKSDTQTTVLQTTVLQTTVNNTVNGVVKGGEKNVLQQLPDLGDPPEKIAYIAKHVILQALGDEKSSRFYELVAAKIPEQVIREVLSEVRVDEARNPARLFTYKIQRYAVGQQRGVTSSRENQEISYVSRVVPNKAVTKR
jgi:Bacteriophage replication protein O